MTVLTGEYEPSARPWVREQVERYESSGGREGNTSNGEPHVPVVIITSVGAKSGKLRKNPVIRVEHDGCYAAVASKGGAAQHPGWYWNFLAHPLVQLQDGPQPRLYRARPVSGDERRQWWDRAVSVWPAYAEYQARTDREIPVFVLEPADESDQEGER
ncbi:deazaflavin-dependent oxidoreductase, nitroreductase family [Pseudonocardia thermophila]|jgi:deazaflavin-dependent nitroreductase family protein|uniref:Deazaflavin-dependent oxidoreductase, nitroreductase family n=1 Tax=Pseudonocardia thermophila TaxID=1848 RepID=A0A1M6QGX4_PSETH|nr:nitroreductase family deazaflavin-dependent oxidoreductase [Pseudonocardia thermophila]SHK19554.1 deazaflavin-dependent oxidoreductase, nitroreductase family [Pseudonocardia thermophila]